METISITLSPSSPLSSYPVTGAPVWRQGAWLCVRDEIDIMEDRRELPEELVLRELPRVNLDNVDTVTDFLDTYGVLGDPTSPLLTAMTGTKRPKGRPENGLVAVVDAANQLRAVRAMTNHWLAWRRQDEVTPAWRAEGFGVLDDYFAWDAFRSILNSGLTSYHPRIELVRRFDKPLRFPDPAAGPDRAESSFERRSGMPTPDLFGGLCRQVFNLVAENLDPHECQNETCKRLFIRQQGGGAGTTQRHTTGLSYCSRLCAKAQAQREYRRRKAAERNVSGHMALPPADTSQLPEGD